MRFSLLQTGVEAGAFQTVNLGCGIWLDLKVCQLENITTWNLKTWNLKSWNLNWGLSQRLDGDLNRRAARCHGPDGSGRLARRERPQVSAPGRCSQVVARGDRWKRMRGRFKVVEQDPGNLDFQWHTQCCQSCAGQLVLILIFHFWGQDYIWVFVDSLTVKSIFATDLLVRAWKNEPLENFAGLIFFQSHPMMQIRKTWDWSFWSGSKDNHLNLIGCLLLVPPRMRTRKCCSLFGFRLFVLPLLPRLCRQGQEDWVSPSL